MKLLLHICCAPCSCYPVEYLREKKIDINGLWFNPNIHPYKEYLNRIKTLKLYSEKVDLPVEYIDEYGLIPFLDNIKGKEKYGVRCITCYSSRIFQTARIAKEKGYDTFSSTLLYSRYQFHEAIKELMEIASGEYKIKCLYEDFRIGWYRGIEISKGLGLYRQKYCGCIFSEYETFFQQSDRGNGIC